MAVATGGDFGSPTGFAHVVLAPATGETEARARVALQCWEPASPRPTLGGWGAHVGTPVVVRHVQQTPPPQHWVHRYQKPGLDVLQYHNLPRLEGRGAGAAGEGVFEKPSCRSPQSYHSSRRPDCKEEDYVGGAYAIRALWAWLWT